MWFRRKHRRCESEFSGLGQEYRCVLAAPHGGWHVDQFDNRWRAPLAPR